VLEANTREAALGDRRFRYTIPSPHRYLYQWHWDSCFHAIVWASIDRERARDELRALVALQTGDGLLPHILYWAPQLRDRFGSQYLEGPGWLPPGSRPAASALIQPPVAAQALEAVLEPEGDDAFLAELLPAVSRHYRYLASVRDPDADGLVSVVSQFETGLDFSPVWDPAPGLSPSRLRRRARGSQALNKLLGNRPDLIFRYRRTHSEDVLVNSVFLDGLTSLERLAARGGDAELERWARERADRTLAALLERCWDERRGLFFTLAGPDERRIAVKTIISLMPLAAERLPAEIAARLVEHLTDPREFWTAYPVPSVAIDEPSFVPDAEIGGERCIWRGPSSPPTNWLLSRGLRRHGFAEQAETIAERNREAAARGGFNEFYDPLEGRAVGAPDFGWGTLAAVM
jgi:glycogen debranching enzyme